MPRTKMVKRKSSMKVKAKSLKRKTSASVDSVASSVSSTGERGDDLSAVLTKEYNSLSHLEEAVEALYEKKVNSRVKKYERSVDEAKNTYAKILKTYPESYLDSALSSTYEGIITDENKDLNIKTNGSGHQSRLQKKEATEFKRPKTPRRTSRKRSSSVPTPALEFRTPHNNMRQQMAMIKTITPKVSSTPVSVMRRPQHGEVAFSTSGSPLLIAAVSREDIPTVSVPMMDGRVFSILPDPGLPPPDLPQFDDDTKKYLKTLRDHLAMLSSP